MFVGKADAGELVIAETVMPSGEAAGDGSDEAAPLAGLLRRALAGASGTATVSTGRGQVLAAYEPVAGRALGVVATIDRDEVRAPFVDAAAKAGGAALLVIGFSALLILAIGRPILAQGRQGNARFRQLFENMRMGAAVFSTVGQGEDFVFSDLNRGAERIDDLERRAVIGRRLSEVFPAVRTTGLLDALRRVGRTGVPEHFPVVYYRDEKRAGWREGYIYRLSSGEVVCLYEDVTERQRAEEALRESEARWRSIIGMQSVAIVVVDAQHKIRYVNKAAEALFAKDGRELQGAEFGFPVVQGEVADIEIIRPNRTIAYAAMRATSMRWAGEDQFLLMLQDVSAHKRAEGDLRKLFQGVEQSPVSVVITDVEGNIEYVNPKFTEVTGYTYAEVMGKNPRVLKSGHTKSSEYGDLWKTIRAGEVWRGEFHNRRKNGELFWELAAIAPVRDARGKITHYVAVKEDITERKATEERLRRSQRLELIGQLTGGIAHDFNNVLAIILGNLQLLQEKGAGDDEDRELVADALWSAERGAELIHRLLAFARRQRLHPKTADLNRIVGEMTHLLRRTLGDAIEIKERFAARTMANPDRPGPTGARAPEPGGQRPRCHAPWRDGDDRHQQRGAGQRVRPQEPGGRARRLRLRRRRRYRHRHAGGRPRAHLRAVLHDEEVRPRQRSRPEHGLRLRASVGWPRRGRERTRPGNNRASVPPQGGNRRGERGSGSRRTGDGTLREGRAQETLTAARCAGPAAAGTSLLTAPPFPAM